ncbi:MAG TPA: hypothetical protein VKO18_02445 [Terriglobia bacterium]|nr:hypothetical protein [Terriglobia bacterium]
MSVSNGSRVWSKLLSHTPLLGCKVCGTRKVVHLDPAELAAYNTHRQRGI